MRPGPTAELGPVDARQARLPDTASAWRTPLLHAPAVYQESTKNPQWQLNFEVNFIGQHVPTVVTTEVNMHDRARHPTFEDACPQIEFAPLVMVALQLTEWIVRRFAPGRGNLAGPQQQRAAS
jgi:hypothetical protein